MWLTFTVIDENGTQTTCPVNMDNVVTYTPIKNDKYPDAESVLYTTGVFVQTMPVVETVEEIDAMIKGELA